MSLQAVSAGMSAGNFSSADDKGALQRHGIPVVSRW